MPTKYRAVFDVAYHRTRDMMKPGFVVEAKRDSKRMCAEVTARFLAELATHIPCDRIAVARLERTDARGYTTQIAKFSGRVTATAPITCAATAGTWTLEEWQSATAGASDDGLPDFVQAGKQP